MGYQYEDPFFRRDRAHAVGQMIAQALRRRALARQRWIRAMRYARYLARQRIRTARSNGRPDNMLQWAARSNHMNRNRDYEREELSDSDNEL